MTTVVYRGGEDGSYTFQGNLSSELEDVHAGSEVELTLTIPDEEDGENGNGDEDKAPEPPAVPGT